ncbi:MAG: FG-GAP repeat domain-containing protein [Planctomycetota bacterium]
MRGMKKAVVAWIFGAVATGLVAQSAFHGPPQVISSAALGAEGVYAADLDGDGDMDVLSASITDNKIAWYANDGAGNFGPQQVISTAANGATSVYAIDLDGDGDADVLSASAFDNKIAWYANDGAGNFGPQQVISTAANGASSVYATDLDGDGDADVLSASSADRKIAWYANDGAGNFGPQRVITTAADFASSVYATDLDGDGDVDVLSASRDDDKIAWYANDGARNFGPQQVITTSADAPYSVYAVDLDGDGDADVLSASYFDDKIAWYETRIVPPTTSTATTYGVGCGAPPLTFTPTSVAITGHAMTARVTNAASRLCFVAIGGSDTVLNGLPVLPLDLALVGMSGCNLYQSTEVLGLPTTGSPVPGQATFSLGVPPAAQLVGQHLYLQAICYAPGANPLGAVTSNGIDFLVGNQ